MSSQKKSKSSVFPVSRLKKILQSNESVGKIGASVPVVASKAIELFLKEFVDKCFEEVKNKGGKKIQNEHIKKVVEETPNLSFLKNSECFKNI
jgi:histone H3/H4